MVQLNNHAHQQGSLFAHPVHDHHPAVFIRFIPGRLPGKHLCDYRQGGTERVASSCTLIYLSSFPLPLAVSLLDLDDNTTVTDIYVVGRTLPYPMIHPKRPTASLVSRNVLASIIGQIVITSAAQFWAFFWVRNQTWYVFSRGSRDAKRVTIPKVLSSEPRRRFGRQPPTSSQL